VSDAIVYAGKHYGRRHKIIRSPEDHTNTVHALHEPSGDVVVCHSCDVEFNPLERPRARGDGIICRKRALDMLAKMGLEVVPSPTGEFKLIRLKT